MGNTYKELLSSRVDLEKLNEVCSDVFKYGNFGRRDEILPLVLPIANIVYFQNIKKYDDRGYAYEDLVSDAVTCLYREMKYRWDKFIHVDDYYDYFKTIFRHLMVQQVHAYHNYYATQEFDPEINTKPVNDTYTYIENRIYTESLESKVLDTVQELLSHHLKRPKLMRDLFETLYIRKEDAMSIFGKYYVLGVTQREFKLYECKLRRLYSSVISYHKALLKEDEKVVRAHEDVFQRIRCEDYELLSLEYGNTMLPELYAELGTENFMKVVSVLGGSTVSFPPARELGDLILGKLVYTLAEGNPVNLERVSNIYALPVKTLQRIFDTYAKSLQKRKERTNA